MLTEQQGCAILRDEFLSAGYDIQDNVLFHEDGIRFCIDGFDSLARVGFEFITTEAGDRTELTAEVISAIEKRLTSGDLLLLLVDEYEIQTEDELRGYARRFLELVASRRRNRLG